MQLTEEEQIALLTPLSEAADAEKFVERWRTFLSSDEEYDCRWILHVEGRSDRRARIQGRRCAGRVSNLRGP